MLKRLALILLATLLCSCGGGGGNAGNSLFGTGSGSTGSTGTGGSGGTANAPAIAVTLSSNVVTTSAPVTVTATVTDATGAAVAGQVVRFTTLGGLGTFGTNSALTNASGKATAVLTAASASASGADTVQATTTLNSTTLQATVGFQLTATTAAITGFTSDSNSVPAYGQANLTVTVTGATATSPATVALSSTCVANGKAVLTPTTATTSTGTATFTYRDNGCGATATSDTVQASISGTSALQSLTLGLTSPTLNGITFTSATPSTIYLQGSGLVQTSTLLFKVVDSANHGLPNQTVTLSLLTAAGGLTLNGGTTPVTVVSDSNGVVSALINSGTVPTPVRVKASLANGTITTVSSDLSVAVGLPTELGFSLAQQTINIEGYDRDNTPNTYTIIASDRLANPVPNGTSINFIAEGGQVEPIKTTALTANGIAEATANYVSAGVRPVDGRVTVLAYALGEESFLDVNGTNVWASNDDWQDLGSVFLSRKFLQTYFPATDQLIPLAIPGDSSSTACHVSTSPLLALSRSIPTVGGSTCDGTWGPAYVRAATETVLSTSSARPVWASAPAGLYAASSVGCPLVQDTTTTPGTSQNLIRGYQEGSGNALRPASPALYAVGGATAIYNASASGVISFIVADANPVRLNPMAAGTTISVTGTTGISVVLQGGSPVPNTPEATFASVSYTIDPTVGQGTITINITSPSLLTTTIGQTLSLSNPPGSGVTACQ